MAILANARHELFAQELFRGKTADEAYQLAGFKPNRGNAATLKANQSVADRLAELQSAASEKAEIDQAWVLSRLASVTERCMQAEQVFDRKGGLVLTETEDGELAKAFVFNAAGANGALGLIGKHLGMFTEKVDVNHGVQDSLADMMARIDGKSRGLP